MRPPLHAPTTTPAIQIMPSHAIRAVFGLNMALHLSTWPAPITFGPCSKNVAISPFPFTATTPRLLHTKASPIKAAVVLLSCTSPGIPAWCVCVCVCVCVCLCMVGGVRLMCVRASRSRKFDVCMVVTSPSRQHTQSHTHTQTHSPFSAHLLTPLTALVHWAIETDTQSHTPVDSIREAVLQTSPNRCQRGFL